MKTSITDLKTLAIDSLVELLDRACVDENNYSGKVFMQIDRACRERTREYNKDFGTNFNSIYQVFEHYKTL